MIKRLPWLRNLKKTDPEPPLRLPIACGPLSNGEGWWPDSARKKLIRKLVNERAEEVSRREGIDRREFMASACGMATTLFMINVVNGCSDGKSGSDKRMGNAGTSGAGNETPAGGDAGMPGPGADGGISTGGFDIPEEATYDEDWAGCVLGNGGKELIIDMQSHFASPETNPLGAAGLSQFVGMINNERYPWIERTENCTGSACFDRMEYVDQIFMGSDTTIGVLSGISYSLGPSGMGSGGFAALTNEDLIDGVAWLEEMFPGRMLSHAMVMPNDRLDVQLAMMDRLADTYDNWKTYPPWSPLANGGYWLDQGEGPTMIQRGLELNSPIFCIHKGFPLNSFSPTYTDPKDVGPAARMFPEARLVIYHSGFEHGLGAGQSTMPGFDPNADLRWGEGAGIWPEGPYDEDDETVQELYPLDRGVNSLIKSLRDSNIGPNGRDLDNPGGPVTTHVYAECGGVWPNLMTNRPEEAMHYWGKLLKHIGEDRIVWGTDCLWFGSPQPLIEAFRAFEISTEFQETYGYPELTQQRKEKILGQNAARLQNIRAGVEIEGCHDDFLTTAQLKLKHETDEEYGRRRDMLANVPGPRTRRDFLKLRSEEHNEKVTMSGRIQRLDGRT
ncbi:MAG: amidohydrolase family protein [Myxococcales bacterium]|nr:amidohydrolase family protein [Myxococcales bacterium]